ncbi:SecYEG protein translocase auxiliary subunit [Gammaproteobacteria bacterium]|nr:SecYEG protein translocase auxiliary subunit [Gammaproteobacteria bacterium]
MLISLFSVAQAQAAQSSQNSILSSVLIFVPIFAIMYFLMIRPQQKRQKEHTALISSVKKGDEIVTASGILGRITHTGDSFIQVEIATNTEIKIQKSSVGAVMPKGTYKGDL